MFYDPCWESGIVVSSDMLEWPQPNLSNLEFTQLLSVGSRPVFPFHQSLFIQKKKDFSKHDTAQWPCVCQDNVLRADCKNGAA